jgi:hypothetical protein
MPAAADFTFGGILERWRNQYSDFQRVAAQAAGSHQEFPKATQAAAVPPAMAAVGDDPEAVLQRIKRDLGLGIETFQSGSEPNGWVMPPSFVSEGLRSSEVAVSPHSSAVFGKPFSEGLSKDFGTLFGAKPMGDLRPWELDESFNEVKSGCHETVPGFPPAMPLPMLPPQAFSHPVGQGMTSMIGGRSSDSSASPAFNSSAAQGSVGVVAAEPPWAAQQFRRGSGIGFRVEQDPASPAMKFATKPSEVAEFSWEGLSQELRVGIAGDHPDMNSPPSSPRSPED